MNLCIGLKKGAVRCKVQRLEKGTFLLPKAAENATRIEISAVDLSMILSGIDLANIKRQKRFQKPAEIAK
jgi:hypothetical protein